MGPIDAAKDKGVGWRDSLKKKLINLPEPITVVDPTTFDFLQPYYNKVKQEIIQSGKINKNTRIQLDKAIEFDLNVTSYANCNVVYWDGTPTVGTIHEILECVSNKIILYVPEQYKHKINPWLLYLIKEIVHTEDELVKKIRKMMKYQGY